MLYLLGTLLLLHGGYLAYEHNYVSSNALQRLPGDIILEVVVGVVLMVYGAMALVRNQPKLSVDGDKVAPAATFLQPIDQQLAYAEKKQLGVHDWQPIELRPDFVDVVAKRREYNAYVDAKAQK